MEYLGETEGGGGGLNLFNLFVLEMPEFWLSERWLCSLSVHTDKETVDLDMSMQW